LRAAGLAVSRGGRDDFIGFRRRFVTALAPHIPSHVNVPRSELSTETQIRGSASAAVQGVKRTRQSA